MVNNCSAYDYYNFNDEKEWNRGRKALEFLDLATDYRFFFEFYKKKPSLEVKCFESSWEIISNRKHWYPFDDCRVLFKWSIDRKDSIYFRTSIENRNPDWIGRNIFLEYVRKTLGLPRSIVDIVDSEMNSDDPNQPETSLELGESAVRFLHLATLCGIYKWKRSYFSELSIHPRHVLVNELIFNLIYPLILRGLYQNREKHPLLTAKLWDMFCVTPKSRRWLFIRIPDKQHLEFMLGVANQTHFDFWGYRNEKCYLNSSITRTFNSSWHPTYLLEFPIILATFMQQGRLELIAVLLMYGFTTNVPENILICSITRRLPFVQAGFSTTKEFEEIVRKLIVSLPMRYENKEPRLPQPHFTQSQREIHRNMEIVSLKCYNDIRDGDVYKLQHMCRMSVRQRLRDNFQLPTGIYVLDLPKLIKEYLNLYSPIPGDKEVLF